VPPATFATVELSMPLSIHIRALAPVVVLSTVLAACGGASERAKTIAGLSPDTVLGAKSFTANCVSCHGSNGSSGSARKNLPKAARNETTEAIDVILSGDGSMPAFSAISDQELANIIGWLKTL